MVVTMWVDANCFSSFKCHFDQQSLHFLLFVYGWGYTFHWVHFKCSNFENGQKFFFRCLFLLQNRNEMDLHSKVTQHEIIVFVGRTTKRPKKKENNFYLIWAIQLNQIKRRFISLPQQHRSVLRAICENVSKAWVCVCAFASLSLSLFPAFCHSMIIFLSVVKLLYHFISVFGVRALCGFLSNGQSKKEPSIGLFRCENYIYMWTTTKAVDVTCAYSSSI